MSLLGLIVTASWNSLRMLSVHPRSTTWMGSMGSANLGGRMRMSLLCRLSLLSHPAVAFQASPVIPLRELPTLYHPFYPAQKLYRPKNGRVLRHLTNYRKVYTRTHLSHPSRPMVS